MQQWNWRARDVIIAHERDPVMYIRGLREAIDAVEQGKVFLDPLLTNTTCPLEELAHALNATQDRPDGFVKALVLTR